MEKEKLELEYMVRSSPGILYNRLVTPGGLSEWFADNVNINHGTYTFMWDGNPEEAEVLAQKEGEFIRFRWMDDQDEDVYFEFRLRIDGLTGEIALIITDFADSDEQDEVRGLWDKQVDN